MTYPLEKDLTQTKHHNFAISKDTFKLTEHYLNQLKKENKKAGTSLKRELEKVDMNTLDTETFIKHIINTKEPKNFAESKLEFPEDREHSGYNNDELKILARIGTVFVSYAYNNGGRYNSYKNHTSPIPCLMGYVPAPLFTFNQNSLDDAMLTRFVKGNKKAINHKRYREEIKQRILPTLLQMNAQAKRFDKKLKVTIPGLGCGSSGGMHGDFGSHSSYSHLNATIKDVIKNHAAELTHIVGIYFDTHKKAIDEEVTKFGNIEYQCFASSVNNIKSKQLELSPDDNQNPDIMLGTIVSASLLSWAGNDMWIDSRKKDEGVKAGSTLTLVQTACSLLPTVYQFKDFEYRNGAFYHKNNSWKEIGAILEKECKYASLVNEIHIHNIVSDENSYTFNFKVLAGLSFIGVSSLTVGILALTSVITAPLGMGVGIVVFGSTVSAGATFYGLFSNRSYDGHSKPDLPVKHQPV